MTIIIFIIVIIIIIMISITINIVVIIMMFSISIITNDQCYYCYLLCFCPVLQPHRLPHQDGAEQLLCDIVYYTIIH